jgi:membrane protease YdiL (CAAX protease family)
VLDWIDPTFRAAEVTLTVLALLVLTATVLRASPERMRARIAAHGLVPAFRRSAATNTLTALLALETVWLGLDPADLGLRPVTLADALIALALPAAAAGTAAFLAYRAGAAPGQGQAPDQAPDQAPGQGGGSVEDPVEDPLSFLRPSTPAERRWAAAAALAAGIGEEIVFRGLLIAAGVGILGLPAWAAAVLAALLFGVGHRYQGLRGMIVTTCAAVVFTTLYALTGNLLVPIALHITVDLVSLLLVPALLDRGPQAAAAEQDRADTAAAEAA